MKKSYHDPGLTASGRCKLFDEENGPFIYWSGYLLFENGAVRENNFYGCLWEPPSEPYALWKRKAEYWRARLTMAVRDFDNYRENHLASINAILGSTQADNGIPNGEEIIANLEKLQKVVTEMNEQAQHCLAMVKKYDPAEARKQRQQEQSQKNKEQAALLKKKIAAIQI